MFQIPLISYIIPEYSPLWLRISQGHRPHTGLYFFSGSLHSVVILSTNEPGVSVVHNSWHSEPLPEWKTQVPQRIWISHDKDYWYNWMSGGYNFPVQKWTCREDNFPAFRMQTGSWIYRRTGKNVYEWLIMAKCPCCGSKLYGYERPYDRLNRSKNVGVACCPWCKWTGTGEKYRDLEDDEVRIPYWLVFNIPGTI